MEQRERRGLTDLAEVNECAQGRIVADDVQDRLPAAVLVPVVLKLSSRRMDLLEDL